MTLLYSKTREELRTGDLLAWKIVKIKSLVDLVLYLYQKILGAKYSHTGTVIRFGDRIFLMEASPPFVRIYPLSMLESFYLIKTNLNVENEVDINNHYYNSLLKHSGKAYSLTDMVRGIFDMKPNDDTLYCSELCLKFYRDIGYTTSEIAGITPDTIIEEIVKLSGNQPVFVTIDREALNAI